MQLLYQKRDDVFFVGVPYINQGEVRISSSMEDVCLTELKSCVSIFNVDGDIMISKMNEYSIKSNLDYLQILIGEKNV